MMEVVDLWGARAPTTPTMRDGEDWNSGDSGHREGDEHCHYPVEGIRHVVEVVARSEPGGASVGFRRRCDKDGWGEAIESEIRERMKWKNDMMWTGVP